MKPGIERASVGVSVAIKDVLFGAKTKGEKQRALEDLGLEVMNQLEEAARSVHVPFTLVVHRTEGFDLTVHRGL